MNDVRDPALVRFAEHYPDLGTGQVPLAPYYDEDWYRRERERVFRGGWLLIGRAERLAAPGDYLVKDLPVLDTSVLVVRGEDGALRAFHNSCRHRGNRVAAGGGGHFERAIQCGFHGWTYALDGTLAYVPDEACFFDLDRARLPLAPLACDTWKGFVFVNTDPAPRETLAQFIGPELDAQVGDYPFGAMELAATYTVELQANWKYVAEAFQEAYHVVAVHKDTVADRAMVSRWQQERRAALRGEPPPGLPPDPEPEHFFSSVRLWGRHRSMSVCGKRPPEAALPPAVGLCYRLMPQPAHAVKTGLNPHGDASWGADLQFVFPNTEVLMAAPNWYLTIAFWPLAADWTRFEVGFYRQPPRTAGELLAMEYIEANFRDVIREDVAALEPAQAMFRSGATEALWLSDQEIPARHSFEVIARHVRGGA
jgi:phenylpropionate dioxygenase-like ring-hydroxylating dioxygenase large terminal subunit